MAKLGTKIVTLPYGKTAGCTVADFQATMESRATQNQAIENSFHMPTLVHFAVVLKVV